MARFDLYCVDLVCDVKVKIFDKKGFDDLEENDLVYSRDDFTAYNFSMLQDELSYLTDDVSASDDFVYKWIPFDDGTAELGIFYYDERNKDNSPIMTYTVCPTLKKS